MYRGPPATGELLSLVCREREAEVVYFANAKFPAKCPGQWEFLDALHTFERSFKWPVASEGASIRCPWTAHIPTLTSKTVLVGRMVDDQGDAKFKVLHGIECMRLMGWDLGHWRGVSPMACPEITSEVLVDIAGNAWNAFAFCALAAASLGAAHAGSYHTSRPKTRTQPLRVES